MSETTSKPMSACVRWIIGVAAIMFFPLTVALIGFYLILYKIPMFVGTHVLDAVIGVYEKWSGE